MADRGFHSSQLASQLLRCPVSHLALRRLALVALMLVVAWPLSAVGQGGQGTKDKGKDSGQDTGKEDPNKVPYHVEHVSNPDHEKDVTWPPQKDVWPPEPKKNGDWPKPAEHKKDHTFPHHVTGYTWPTFSPHGGSANDGGGWAPHDFKLSYPPYHLEGYTWPPHIDKLSWPPQKSIDPPQKDSGGKYPPSQDHRKEHTFADHKKDKTFPDHFKDVTWDRKQGPFNPGEPSPKEGQPPPKPEKGKEGGKSDLKNQEGGFAPPTDRSIGVLAGKPQVFVAGEVTADEPMLVTVRGPNSFEGVVVSAEANGQKVEAKPDEHGHTRLELSVLGAGLATGTAILIHVTDSSGKPIAAAQTKLGAAVPPAAAPPEVPNLPPLLRNGDVVTMTGKNLGTQAQLVVGNQAQETLAASSNEVTSFVDAPATGPQPAYVSTPNGTSPSQTTNCFNFKISAPQTTISRGQHITATANYEGLPPGSQIKFTNATPQVVSMNVPGGIGQGVESMVTVQQSTGSIPVNLVGQGNGAFVIHYEVIPPPEMRTNP